jgi:hypothetical protein
MKPLVASAIGGISPYLVSLAKNLLTSKPSQHFSDFVSPLFFVGLILLALIGAAVGFLLQETDIKKAFVLGISAPALISSTLSTAESSGKGLAIALPAPVTTAYAQKAESSGESPATQIPGRMVEINLQSPSPVNAQLLDAHGNAVFTVVLNKSVQIPVPASAEKIQFEVGDSRSKVYPLPAHTGERKAFDVNVTGVRNFGFAQALGAPPVIEYRISVAERSL